MSRLSPGVFGITSAFLSDRSNVVLQSHLAMEGIIEKELSLTPQSHFCWHALK